MTGPILLGLGIASSLLMYMFFNAFGASNNDYGGGYGDGFFRNHFKKVVYLIEPVVYTIVLYHTHI